MHAKASGRGIIAALAERLDDYYACPSSDLVDLSAVPDRDNGAQTHRLLNLSFAYELPLYKVLLLVVSSDP